MGRMNVHKKMEASDIGGVKARGVFQMVPLMLCCALLSLGCSSMAEAPPDFEGEWTALSLLNRSVQAYGGPAAILDFQDITIRCDIDVFNGQAWVHGSTLMRMTPPDRLLSQTVLEKVGEKVVYSNAHGQGERIDGQSTGRDVTDDLRQSFRRTRIHAFFLEDQAEHVTITANTTLDKRPCTVLTRTAGQEKWRIWIDLDQFLIRKIRLVLAKAESASNVPGALSVEWLFSNFKYRGIRNVPFSYKTYLNGKLFQKGEVTEVLLNQGLKEEDFRF